MPFSSNPFERTNPHQNSTTVVELKVHLQKVFDLKDQESHWHVIVLCNAGVNNEILSAKPLRLLMGIDFLPNVTWSDDPERLDHYPDGIADIATTPNKPLNAMISALAENRILRNFSMNYYNSNLEGFIPQTYQPTPYQTILDGLNATIGMCEQQLELEWKHLINPFYWLKVIFLFILRLPVNLIGLAGFNVSKFEEQFWGKLFNLLWILAVIGLLIWLGVNRTDLIDILKKLITKA